MSINYCKICDEYHHFTQDGWGSFRGPTKDCCRSFIASDVLPSEKVQFSLLQSIADQLDDIESLLRRSY